MVDVDQIKRARDCAQVTLCFFLYRKLVDAVKAQLLSHESDKKKNHFQAVWFTIGTWL